MSGPSIKVQLKQFSKTRFTDFSMLLDYWLPGLVHSKLDSCIMFIVHDSVDTSDNL